MLEESGKQNFFVAELSSDNLLFIIWSNKLIYILFCLTNHKPYNKKCSLIIML